MMIKKLGCGGAASGVKRLRASRSFAMGGPINTPVAPTLPTQASQQAQTSLDNRFAGGVNRDPATTVGNRGGVGGPPSWAGTPGGRNMAPAIPATPAVVGNGTQATPAVPATPPPNPYAPALPDQANRPFRKGGVVKAYKKGGLVKRGYGKARMC